MSVLPVAVPRLPRTSGASLRSVGASLALPRVLLCDLDGTLIDSMPVLADIATEVLGEVYGTPPSLAREFYLATCGLPFFRQLESIFPGDARNASASEIFEGRKPERCNRIRMSPDVVRTLAGLQRRGVDIVISSNNGIENVAAFADASGFPFDLTLGFGGGLAKGRPHIEMCEKTFGVDRSQMLFVGDSLHDGEIAEREGISFVGVASTFSYERFVLRFPDVPVVRRFSDLADLIAWPETAKARRSEALPIVGNG